MPKGDADRRVLVLRSGLDLCLLALLEGQAIYGYELTRRLAEHGLPVADGSSYPLLGRLERQGLVATELRPSTAGPPRKYYSLSPQGHQALTTGRAEWLLTAEAMSALLRPVGTDDRSEPDGQGFSTQTSKPPASAVRTVTAIPATTTMTTTTTTGDAR